MPEDWHYSLGHWVEDDPSAPGGASNFAYSSGGAFVSDGYNIISDASGPAPATGDLKSTDPKLSKPVSTDVDFDETMLWTRSLAVQDILAHRRKVQELGHLVAPLDVRFVVLLHETRCTTWKVIGCAVFAAPTAICAVASTPSKTVPSPKVTLDSDPNRL